MAGFYRVKQIFHINTFIEKRAAVRRPVLVQVSPDEPASISINNFNYTERLQAFVTDKNTVCCYRGCLLIDPVRKPTTT